MQLTGHDVDTQVCNIIMCKMLYYLVENIAKNYSVTL